jgi:phosphoribosyl 1,2-cyclic phosphodiesterase
MLSSADHTARGVLAGGECLPDEVAALAAFGHAAADYAVALGRLAGVRQVLLAHHKPDRTDAELDSLADRLAAVNPRVVVAAEGGTLDL